jgi:hypothetical protein
MPARVIRSIAVLSCLVLTVSFALFALDQARSASQTSVREIAGKTQYGPPAAASDAHHTWVRRTIDSGATALDTPFTSLGLQSSDHWADRGALFALGLLVYGAGLGFLARWVGSGPVKRRPGHGDSKPPGQVFAA